MTSCNQEVSGGRIGLAGRIIHGHERAKRIQQDVHGALNDGQQRRSDAATAHAADDAGTLHRGAT